MKPTTYIISKYRSKSIQELKVIKERLNKRINRIPDPIFIDGNYESDQKIVELINEYDYLSRITMKTVIKDIINQ